VGVLFGVCCGALVFAGVLVDCAVTVGFAVGIDVFVGYSVAVWVALPTIVGVCVGGMLILSFGVVEIGVFAGEVTSGVDRPDEEGVDVEIGAPIMAVNVANLGPKSSISGSRSDKIS
jgi:hypothetical protein